MDNNNNFGNSFNNDPASGQGYTPDPNTTNPTNTASSDYTQSFGSAQNDYTQSAYGQSSADQSSFGQPQTDYSQTSYGQSSFGQSSLGQSSFGQSSYGQPQTDFTQSAYSQNSYSPSATSTPTSTPIFQQQAQSYAPPQSSSNKYSMQDLETPVSMGDWILSYVILMVPCVNFIMLFVWAFSKTEPKSKTNWAKAQLIIMGVATVLLIIFYAAIFATAFSAYKGAAIR